jgi:hypothetical protein
MDKYNIGFPKETQAQDLKRLINQLWKLIPMRENGEDWKAHLNVLIEEISGLVEIYKNNVNGLILLSKLEGLTSKTCEDFMLYRKTVFRCIELLTQVIENE